MALGKTIYFPMNDTDLSQFDEGPTPFSTVLRFYYALQVNGWSKPEYLGKTNVV